MNINPRLPDSDRTRNAGAGGSCEVGPCLVDGGGVHRFNSILFIVYMCMRRRASLVSCHHHRPQRVCHGQRHRTRDGFDVLT